LTISKVIMQVVKRELPAKSMVMASLEGRSLSVTSRVPFAFVAGPIYRADHGHGFEGLNQYCGI
jgi:hypothetical protein